MLIYRSALSACVLRDLPDVEYYMPLDRDRLSEEGRRSIERNSRQSGLHAAAALGTDTTADDSVASATIAILPANRNQANDRVVDHDDDGGDEDDNNNDDDDDDVIFIDIRQQSFRRE